MSQIYFSKEEKLGIENNILKINNLQMQIQILQSEQQKFVNDFCAKNNQKIENAVNMNLQDGYIEFQKSNIEQN